ncbi:PAAR domain-containing protein [Enterobacter kobei]|uniref:PAAR domain-containing protein n=1 Tax=Enterobacter kobei TaxID=208224 RepID=UPI003CF8F187
MTKGFWIVKGDKTSCGGTVLEGARTSSFGGNFLALNGSKVSCGVHPGVYKIAGGHPDHIHHGVNEASTLYSRSTCPCKARLIPSQTWASHGLTPASPDTRMLQKPVRKISLTLGVFFDGYDSEVIASGLVPEPCTARYHNVSDFEAETILTKCAQDNFGTHGTDNSEPTSSPTNIQWLHRLYKHKYAIEDDIARFSFLIKDGMYACAGDESNSEARRRTSHAITIMRQELKSYFLQLQGSHPDFRLLISAVQFDLFGFGRGAAAARHFAVRVHSRDEAIAQAFQDIFGDVPLMHESIRFIGIFDTLVLADKRESIHRSCHNPGKCHETMLSRGIADNVFHITAEHEYRFNYVLDSIKPDWPEVALPGSHSDIGGGYLPVVTETHFLTRPHAGISEDGDWTVQAFEPECAPCMAPGSKALNPTKELWQAGSPSAKGDMVQPHYILSALSIRNRIVRNDWSKIALHVMIDAAQEAGLQLEEMHRYKELAIPHELQPLYMKAIRMGKDVRSDRVTEKFFDDEIGLLAAGYIHSSANWNATIAGTITPHHARQRVSNLIGFVNRPEQHWRRTVVYMEANNII